MASGSPSKISAPVHLDFGEHLNLKNVFINELLTFVRNSLDRGLTQPRICTIVKNFYNYEEIKHAKAVLIKNQELFGISKRIKHPTKNLDDDAKITFDINQIIESVINLDAIPNVKVVFAAVNLSRLPPLDDGEVNMLMMQNKISEIERKINVIPTLIEKSSTLVDFIQNNSVISPSAHQCVNTSGASMKSSNVNDHGDSNQSFIKRGNDDREKNPRIFWTSRPKFSNIGTQRKELQSDNHPSQNTWSSIVKKRQDVMVGSRETNEKVKVIPARDSKSFPKRAHVFLSRISVDTQESEIIDWVKEIGFKLVSLEALKPRFQNQEHVTYHVTLEKGDIDYQDFLDPKAWPAGAIVKRWFLPRTRYSYESQDTPLDVDYNDGYWN